MLNIGTNYHIEGSVAGDKSITHRALILASIASGSVHISNASICDDCMSTVTCLRALGATITIAGSNIVVQPISTANSGVVLDCGNSGTTARLIAGLVAGLGVEATLVGDNSLTTRPMGRVIEPLTHMGAQITVPAGSIMHIHGGHKLHGITYHMPVASAQVKSALLIAGLFATGTTSVVEDISTRDHTERMLAHMGVQCSSCTVVASRPSAVDIDVPADMSTAIYGIVLSLCDGGTTLYNVGINEGRMGAIEALWESGATIALHNKRLMCGEWRADITVLPSSIQPLYLDASTTVSAIDDILPLVVLASRIDGTSTICGIAELAHKESNRIEAIVDIVSKMGGIATVAEDSITICGNSERYSHITTCTADHRVAMTTIVAGLLGSGATVYGYRCISVSCPQFLSWLGISYRKFALIGSSIASSLSPAICALHSRASGINASYQLVPVDNATDDMLLDIISCYDGVNVTMPYKQQVARLTNSPLDSVNTVCGTVTASTDGVGMVASIRARGIQLQGARVLVIGAGGASLSVVRALLDSGCKVYVVNRTTSKADIINRQLSLVGQAQYDGIVSCVPPCGYELDAIQGHVPQWIASVIYKSDSMLAQWAKDNNIKYIGGLGMLYYQAQASYNIWCNTTVDDCYMQLEEIYENTTN